MAKVKRSRGLQGTVVTFGGKKFTCEMIGDTLQCKAVPPTHSVRLKFGDKSFDCEETDGQVNCKQVSSEPEDEE